MAGGVSHNKRKRTMKLISKATVHYGKGLIAPAGALFDVDDATAAGLIDGGYADKYEAPKTAAQLVKAAAEKAAEKDEAGGDL